MINNKKIIFVVDDNETNLVACKQILKPYYTVYPVLSAAKMFDLLEHIKPDLILLDIEMPEMNGQEAVKILKNNEVFKRLPVVFLSAKNDIMEETRNMNSGVLDFIHKPFVSSQLIERIGMYLGIEDCQ
jgi:putative two-component system response regulator